MASAEEDDAAAGEDDPAAGDDEVTDSEEMIGISDHVQRQIPNSSGGEESRRMFQKLWTHSDEMKVLQGFLDFTSKRGTTHANYQHDTGPFFDAIRPRLQFDFNKNQIAEKLRRLKKKYRNTAAKMGSGRGFSFKSPHDRATYEISREIWSSTFNRKPKNRPNQEDRTSGGGGLEVALVPAEASLAEERGSVPPPEKAEPVAAAATSTTAPTVEEEAVRICVAPVLKELVQFAVAGVTAAPPIAAAMEGNERWRRQRIMELELYLKRMELVEEWVRSALEKLRSMGS